MPNVAMIQGGKARPPMSVIQVGFRDLQFSVFNQGQNAAGRRFGGSWSCPRFELRDMSRKTKAATCRRTPNDLPY